MVRMCFMLEDSVENEALLRGYYSNTSLGKKKQGWVAESQLMDEAVQKCVPGNHSSSDNCSYTMNYGENLQVELWVFFVFAFVSPCPLGVSSYFVLPFFPRYF